MKPKKPGLLRPNGRFAPKQATFRVKRTLRLCDTISSSRTRGTKVKRRLFGGCAVLTAGISAPATARPPVTIGISGWTGFAPLTLTKGGEGLFEEARPRRHLEEDSAGSEPAACLAAAACSARRPRLNIDTMAATSRFSSSANPAAPTASSSTTTSKEHRRPEGQRAWPAQRPAPRPISTAGETRVLNKSGMSTKDVERRQSWSRCGPGFPGRPERSPPVTYESRSLRRARSKPDQDHIIAKPRWIIRWSWTRWVHSRFPQRPNPDAAKGAGGQLFRGLDLIRKG